MPQIVGDFNINLLDYEKRKKVQEFLNLIYELISLPESPGKAPPQLNIS